MRDRVEVKDIALRHVLQLQSQNGAPLSTSELIDDAEKVFKWLCKTE